MQPEYPIEQLCQTLGVTHSGYHAWATRRPGSRAQANAALLPLMEQAHEESRQTYGFLRVHRWLQQRGQPVDAIASRGSCGRQNYTAMPVGDFAP
jgi:hypothetical protein